jgi:hypothetical protein
MRALLSSVALGLSLFASGCIIVEEDDPVITDPVPARGDLGIYWTFDSYDGCGDVSDVNVALYDPYGDLYDDSLYGCAIGGLTYEQVDEGWWTVELTGYDRYGRVVVSSGSVDLFVNGFANNDFDIDMR